jgi:hypothetical protein
MIFVNDGKNLFGRQALRHRGLTQLVKACGRREGNYAYSVCGDLETKAAG